MRTAQELFDTVVTHLRKQGRKSKDDDICCYRHYDGLSCAIGCLIPDGEYNLKMERLGVEQLSQRNLLTPEREAEFSENIKLLKELQTVHDLFPISNWEKEWIILAKNFNLNYTKP